MIVLGERVKNKKKTLGDCVERERETEKERKEENFG
jgi:hypothetical protein